MVDDDTKTAAELIYNPVKLTEVQSKSFFQTHLKLNFLLLKYGLNGH